MPVKINSSGGGSVTLDVPVTASTFTATIPAVTGTLVTDAGGSTVQFGAGSASAPSITTTGDTNTGIYFPGADRIGFAEGGAQVGEFDASGNLQFNSGYGSVATAYGCRAWVNFNGTGTVAIRGSGNVSSITDNGVGDYTVNLSTAMPDTNYAAIGSYQYDNGTPPNVLFFDQSMMVYPHLTNQVLVYNGYVNSGGSGRTDVVECCIAVFR
jgi:hypothetical protein